jgi:hypothetical protein
MSGKIQSIQAQAVQISEIYPVLRYAFGASIIITSAMALNYTLAYLTPVLAIGFLAPDAPPPTLKGSLFFLLMIAFSCFTGFAFSSLFLDYPLVFIPLLLLALFHLYYSARLHQMKVWFIISILLIPMVSMENPQLGKTVAVNLFMNALLAILLVTLVYFIFPQKTLSPSSEKKKQPGNKSEKQRFMQAVRQIIVVAPLSVLFFVFNWTGALLVLIFVSLLSMNPAAASKKTGLALIIANLGGGIMAIAAFNLLTIVPELVFMSLLTLLTGLIFGVKLYERKPISPLFGTAFSTFLLILGNVTSFTGEAGEMVWSRIIQLGVVVVYIVLAFYLVNSFIPPEKPENQYESK